MSEWAALKQETRRSTRALLAPLALMWALQVLNTLTGGRLNALGVEPRTLVGLRGLVFAPLLHAGFAHLIANSVPWLAAGGLIVLTDVREFVIATASAWLLGGLGEWTFGAPGSVHVGASGVVFGFFGYLLVRGWLRRSLVGIAVSLLLGSTYGMVLFLGVLPGHNGISWQAHAFGFLGGVLAAFFTRPRAARASRPAAGARRDAAARR